MDFELSEDQLAYREAARQFADRYMAADAAQWDKDHHFPVDVIRQAGDQGFCSIYTPEKDGGLGLSRLEASLIFEEMATACPSTTAYLTIHNMVTWMVASFARESVRARELPAMTSGQHLASYCLTEPNAGSDAASLKTRAECHGDHYVLTGSKMFISGAGATQRLVVMARTGPADSGARGISAFLVDAGAEGISYGQNEEKLGWHSQPTRQVSFDGVVVPADDRLGEEGDGFSIAMKALDGGRINIASCSLGGAHACLTRARDYLQQRQQFGKPLAEFQALQFRLADMATRLTAARQMVRLAADRLDRRHAEATVFCAMAKQHATDACFDVCNEALQLHGGYGYIRDYAIERYVRDLRVHQILEGTNEIMRLITARRILEPGVLEAIR